MTKKEIKARLEAIEEEKWYAGVAYDWREGHAIIMNLNAEKDHLMEMLSK